MSYARLQTYKRTMRFAVNLWNAEPMYSRRPEPLKHHRTNVRGWRIQGALRGEQVLSTRIDFEFGSSLAPGSCMRTASVVRAHRAPVLGSVRYFRVRRTAIEAL